jgi:hypothetical protein
MNIPEHLCIYDFALPEEPSTIKSFAEKYLQIKTKNEQFISTKARGMTATGGLGNYRIWSATNQLVNQASSQDE